MKVVEEVIVCGLRPQLDPGKQRLVWVAVVSCYGVLSRWQGAHTQGMTRSCSSEGRIFVFSLSGAADRLANSAEAGMQGLELPRCSLAATSSYLLWYQGA